MNDFETLAKQLKADGYNAGVVARKLISQYGMAEEDAVPLVERLFGRRADPRGGETVGPLLAGLGFIGLGLGGALFMGTVGVIHVGLALACLSGVGLGLTMVVKTLVNAGAKTPL